MGFAHVVHDFVGRARIEIRPLGGVIWAASWNEEARASSVTAHLRSSLFSAQRWRRLLSGKIEARALASAILNKTWLRIAAGLSRLRGAPPVDPVEELFKTVVRAGTELRLVCSEGDASMAYLEAHVRRDHRPAVTVLAGADHTIRPVWGPPPRRGSCSGRRMSGMASAEYRDIEVPIAVAQQDFSQFRSLTCE